MNTKETFPETPKKASMRRKWGIYNSHIDDYLFDFEQADTEHKVQNMFSRLGDGSIKDPVVIDLMASKKALSDIHKNYNVPTKGLLAVGTNFELWDKISYIRGDLNKKRTWKRMNHWLGERKANVIMSRGYQALDYIPTTLFYQRKVLSEMWDMADDDGGLLILQSPSKEVLKDRGIPLDAWLDQLKTAGIYSNFSDMLSSSDNPDHRYGRLILEKNPNTPYLPDIESSDARLVTRGSKSST